MTDKLEGAAEAIAQLERAIRARIPLIGIETAEEGRVMEEIEKLAAKATVGVTGDIEVESRVVFKWTHTNGIVRQGKLPTCTACDKSDFTAEMTLTKDEEGLSIYSCPQCQNTVPAEFPQGTEDPSFAIQDFVTWAVGDGRRETYLERASILVMCDIHRFLMPAEAGGENSTRTMRALRDLAAMLPPTKSVAVLMAPYLGSLGDAGRHVHKVQWPLPTIDELTDMVRGVGKRLEAQNRVPVDMNGATEDLGAALAGLTFDEAVRVLKLVVVQEKRLEPDMAPMLMALKAQVLEQSTGIKVRIPRFTLDDVGGLDLLKEDVKRLPKYLKQGAKDANVRAPRGYLLGGPPGIGKSLVAEVMAAAANIPLLEWNLGESKSKWYGESEQQVAEVLRAADAVGRCVLWIDEGEKQTSAGGDGEGHEVTESIMGAMLSWMQDNEGDVIIAMTVNHPDRLRDELVSRFDSKWFIDYPNADAAEAIIDIHTSRRGVKLDESDIATMAKAAVANELCGREIEHLIEEAKRQAFFEDRSMAAADLLDLVSTTKGLAMQPKRKSNIDSMRRECIGQFKPAASYTATLAARHTQGDGLEIDL
jgi:ATP-dependent 26S proteasome regulatory subunit